MSEKEFANRHPLLIRVLNILLWGTVFGGTALGIAIQVAKSLVIAPFFGTEVPVGSALATICYSTAFVCSVGYAGYMVIHWNKPPS